MSNMRRSSTWHRLMESTEGPTVTIQIPREWAEELMRSLMTSLEIEDMGDEPDEDGEPHAEPDEDDIPGIPGMDDDDGDELNFSGEDDDEPELAAGDSDDDDEDDDDETDEGISMDMDGGRPATALGESAFAKLSRKLGTGRLPRARR